MCFQDMAKPGKNHVRAIVSLTWLKAIFYNNSLYEAHPSSSSQDLKPKAFWAPVPLSEPRCSRLNYGGRAYRGLELKSLHIPLFLFPLWDLIIG